MTRSTNYFVNQLLDHSTPLLESVFRQNDTTSYPTVLGSDFLYQNTENFAHTRLKFEFDAEHENKVSVANHNRAIQDLGLEQAEREGNDNLLAPSARAARDEGFDTIFSWQEDSDSDSNDSSDSSDFQSSFLLLRLNNSLLRSDWRVYFLPLK
jgi:hypothetical protein